MTDTTDIKALSYARLQEIKSILSGFEDGYDTVDDKENYEAMRGAQLLIDELISLRDQLEAERQRADYVQRVIDQRNSECDRLIKELEAAEARVKELEEQKAKWVGWATQASNEVDKLKGDQVPVAWRFKNESGEYRVSIEKKPNTYGRTDFEPLFTAPQKQVLHPDTKRMDWLCAHAVEVRDPQMYGSHAMFHAQQDSEEWDLPHHTTLREQVDAAIEAAGGIVKDGE